MSFPSRSFDSRVVSYEFTDQCALRFTKKVANESCCRRIKRFLRCYTYDPRSPRRLLVVIDNQEISSVVVWGKEGGKGKVVILRHFCRSRIPTGAKMVAGKREALCRLQGTTASSKAPRRMQQGATASGGGDQNAARRVTAVANAAPLGAALFY